jgi:hypothetical protein
VLSRNSLARSLGVSENAFSAGGEKIADLVLLQAGEPN